MSRLKTLQTNFTAGEISPRLAGRGDLRAYANGAQRLSNVFIQPTGGVDRRDGLYFVDGLPGPARLIAFEFNTEQTYLLACCDQELRIYRDGARIAVKTVPWGEGQLGQLTWTQSADTLLICHPELAPRTLTRKAEDDWEIRIWRIVTQNGVDRRPFHRFAPPEVKLKPSGLTGTVTVEADAPIFLPSHDGALLVIQGKQLEIDRVDSSTVVSAIAREELAGTSWTEDWAEAAWSPARGWPISASFHQDRLVIGGSRDLPNWLWMSRSADFFNFDVGQGLDDQAIAFPILSDQVNAIRAVFSGRHLQVFTSGAEWMVSGDPLTPQTVQLHRQTRIGSRVDRAVPPRDVEGATLFVSRNGQELREFLYTDVEQAYRSVDLALLADFISAGPIDQDYDQTRRLLFVAMADGSVGVLTAYRAERVTAWTRLHTAGTAGAVALAGGETYMALQRANGWMLESLDPAMSLDSALSGESDQPTDSWSGLDHLDNQWVRVVGDDMDLGDFQVGNGAIMLDQPVSAMTAGLAYTHEIVPLAPFLLGSGGGSQGTAMRPIETIFRLHETRALVLDTGRGPTPVPLGKLDGGAQFGQPPPVFTGDRRVRHLGWTRSATEPLWRIVQDAPLPFTLLSVTTELKVND